MSSAPLSQGAEADVTAEQATFRFVAAHSPLAPQRERGFAIPADGWTVVDPAQAHHRPFRDANWPPLLPRNTSFWSIVVDTLLLSVVALTHDEEYVGVLHDAAVLQALAFEVLWRTQADLRPLTTHALLENKANSSISAAFRGATSIGHDLFGVWHRFAFEAETFEPLQRAAAAYNESLRAHVVTPEYVVLDEIVLDTRMPYKFIARKKNASGPEFFVASAPVPSTRTSIHLWLWPRLWAKDQGPPTASIVEQVVVEVIRPTAAVPFEHTPMLVADARFSTQAALHRLCSEKRVPFLMVINKAWQPRLTSFVENQYRAIQSRLLQRESTGAVTWSHGSDGWRTELGLRDAEPQHVRVRPDVDQNNIDTEPDDDDDDQRRSKRRRRAPARLVADILRPDGDVDDDVADADDEIEDADDAVELVRGDWPSDMRLNVEYYTGLREARRQKAMVLFGNILVSEPHRGRIERDPVAPLFSTFSATWRRADQVNRTLKEHMMLHTVADHRMTPYALQVDFLLANTQHTLHALRALQLGKAAGNGADELSLASFGVELARMLVDAARACGAGAHNAKNVRVRF